VSLEERVKALEEQWQRLADAILAAPKPKPQPQTGILSQFPTEIADLLIATEENGSYIIKPKQFLVNTNFAKAAEIVKTLGGEYISAGKNSHFRIKKA
jgi:hypothetical protein